MRIRADFHHCSWLGENEVLLDDTLRMDESVAHAGVDVEVCIGRRMQHDFPLTLPWLAESRDTRAVVGDFVERVVQPAACTNA